MLKKIFIAAFMLALTVTQNVSAEEVFIFHDAGYDYYVLTETFNNKTKYRDNRAFDVTVKTLYNKRSSREMVYSFWENDGIVWYKFAGNDESYPIFDRDPALRIWYYGLKFLQLDYDVNYD